MGHIAFTFAIGLLGNVIIDYYKVGTNEPTTNIIFKTIDFIAVFLFGFGPYVYQKLSHFPLIIKRLLMILIAMTTFVLVIFIGIILEELNVI